MSEPARGRLLPLDGLRACAIVLVLLHHVVGFRLGWIGVHVFFLLSGFLITGILRRERNDRCFWAPFYLKRATRILPPLVIFFVMCALLGEARFDVRTAGFAFFSANLLQSLPEARTDELTVLWSLAVEEHFYLLWPFAIRYLNRRAVVGLAAAVVVLSPVARALATRPAGRWEPIYFLTPFQLDGLAMGSLLAVLLEEDAWHTRLRRVGAPVFVLALACLLALGRLPGFEREANSVAFNALGYSLLVLAGGAVLLELVLQPRGWMARALSWRPLVWLGGISYGLYLYHGPVLRATLLLREHGYLTHGRLVPLVGVLVAFGMSAVSFRFYERPLLHWGRAQARRLGEAP